MSITCYSKWANQTKSPACPPFQREYSTPNKAAPFFPRQEVENIGVSWASPSQRHILPSASYPAPLEDLQRIYHISLKCGTTRRSILPIPSCAFVTTRTTAPQVSPLRVWAVGGYLQPPLPHPSHKEIAQPWPPLHGTFPLRIHSCFGDDTRMGTLALVHLGAGRIAHRQSQDINHTRPQNMLALWWHLPYRLKPSRKPTSK